MIYEPYNNSYWIRNFSYINKRFWSINVSYPKLIWPGCEYEWHIKWNEIDYPAFWVEGNNLELSDYTDWRIPAKEEWLILGDNILGEINFTNYGFTNLQSSYFWFWLSNGSSSFYVFIFYPNSGFSHGYLKSEDAFVSCVFQIW